MRALPHILPITLACWLPAVAPAGLGIKVAGGTCQLELSPLHPETAQQLEYSEDGREWTPLGASRYGSDGDWTLEVTEGLYRLTEYPLHLPKDALTTDLFLDAFTSVR